MQRAMHLDGISVGAVAALGARLRWPRLQEPRQLLLHLLIRGQTQTNQRARWCKQPQHGGIPRCRYVDTLELNTL